MFDAPTFFIDRSLEGRVVSAALIEAGASIETHSAHFAHDEPDVNWLGAVAQNGWFVLSCDRHIISRSWELKVLRASNAGVFFLIGGQLRASDKAEILVEHFPKIIGLSQNTPRPFVWKLYRDGQMRAVEFRDDQETPSAADTEDEP